MGKVNPAMLKRPAQEKVPLKWTTPNLSEPIEGTFKKMSSIAWNRASEEAQALTALHITGYGEKGQAGYVEPVNLPPTDGQRTLASFQGFCVACLLSMAQDVQNEADRYSPIDFICFMQDEELADKMAADAQKLRIVAKVEVEDDPNPAAASTEA